MKFTLHIFTGIILLSCTAPHTMHAADDNASQSMSQFTSKLATLSGKGASDVQSAINTVLNRDNINSAAQSITTLRTKLTAAISGAAASSAGLSTNDITRAFASFKDTSSLDELEIRLADNGEYGEQIEAFKAKVEDFQKKRASFLDHVLAQLGITKISSNDRKQLDSLVDQILQAKFQGMMA